MEKPIRIVVTLTPKESADLGDKPAHFALHAPAAVSRENLPALLELADTCEECRKSLIRARGTTTHLVSRHQPDHAEVAIKPAPPKPKRQTVNEILAIPDEPKPEKKEPTGKPSLLDLC